MTRRPLFLVLIFLLVAGVTAGIAFLLVTVFTHRVEERTPFVRLVEVDEISTDPVPWGTNWPWQFDTYKRTVDVTQTRYGGSSAMPQSKLEEQPWLKRLYANYAFSIDYRERRGHAYMLYDQEVTERVLQRPQAGACLHCHASMTPTWRRLGLEDMGQPADAEALAAEFNWPAVMRGFEVASQRPYSEMRAEVLKTPDGTPDEHEPLFPGGEPSGGEASATGEAHPVSCIDCHDPETMKIRVTRPGFVRGIAELAASEEPVPHLPSIERWRQGDRAQAYDPNVDADRSEMRSYVCGQCHVEYYCATKMTLTFPWGNGLKVEQIESYWDETKFPDGSAFYDFEHGETGAHVYKAQHPEFEMWSQGVHARSGVACADCHMPYERQGAMKVSNHWVKSPLLSVNQSCQTCHTVDEAELQGKVYTIQDRTAQLIERAAVAMTDMLDAIGEAKAAGATPDQLAPILELQKKAQWRLDFVSSENSMGFHADQESARILAESIDYSRQAEAAALQLRAPTAPAYVPTGEVHGVTPAGKAPPGQPPAQP
jgi:nitrite reductase (cytochrome c-552)